MKQRGISLVEIILVSAAVIIVTMIVSNLPKSIALITRSQHTSIAKDAANKQMSVLRTKSYNSLSNGTTSFTDSQLSALPSVHAEYKIEDCSVLICQNGEVMKKVTITIIWNEQSEVRRVTLTSLMADGGIGR